MLLQWVIAAIELRFVVKLWSSYFASVKYFSSLQASYQETAHSNTEMHTTHTPATKTGAL